MSHSTLAPWRIRQQILSRKYRWLENAIVVADDEIQKKLEELSSKTPPYDLFQVEALLSEISEGLDRCLAFRKECQEYEVSATMYALEYELFADQVDALQELENTDSLQAQRLAEAAAHKNAVTAFEGDNQELTAGLKEVSRGLSEAAKIAGNWEAKKATFVAKKWDALRSYHKALRERHSAPGCALNFEERIARALPLLLDELTCAYWKARSAEAGLQQIFGIGTAPLAACRTLDGLVTWVRDAIEKLSIHKEKESSFLHVVMMMKAYKKGSASVMPWPDYLNVIGEDQTGRFEFDLANHLPKHFGRARVKSIGLSYSRDANVDLTNPNNSRHALSGVVIPPPQKNSIIGADQARNAIVISRFGIFKPDAPPEMVAAPSINNIDPKGKWAIIVGQIDDYPDNQTDRWRGKGFADIRLHLQLAGVVEPASVANNQVW
jgi:hypothetical protein